MKSPDHPYYPGLDHLRGIAAFLVFAWHFQGELGAPRVVTAIPPLAFVDQGHCGVALFLVLSGYLFAKLLEGHRVLWRRFYYNRVLRLTPLLLVAMILQARHHLTVGLPLSAFMVSMAEGFILPTWPGGAWSIAVELQFYCLLPLLLIVLRRRPWSLLWLIAVAMVIRTIIWSSTGSVQVLAYNTMIGRIDQFVLGMLAWHAAAHVRKQHWFALAVGVLFTVFYYWFDLSGQSAYRPGFPSTAPVWIVLPTVEGIGFSVLVAYYDQSFTFTRSLLARALALVGTISYSVYLLHIFAIHKLLVLFGWLGMHQPSANSLLLFELAGYLMILPVCWASYRVIERPFLRLRVPYLDTPPEMAVLRQASSST